MATTKQLTKAEREFETARAAHETIYDLLGEMFDSVREDFEASLVEWNIKRAHSQVAAHKRVLSENEREPRSWGSYYRRGEYVRFNTDGLGAAHALYVPVTWDMQRENPDRLWADVKKAEQDARDAVNTTRAAFVHKQTVKLAAALGRRGSYTCNGELNVGVGVVTGWISVKCGNGDSFRLNLSVTYNVSKLGKPFTQFPARFADVVLNGENRRSMSEAKMKREFATK